ncbi:MAG: anion transporter [bacterium]
MPTLFPGFSLPAPDARTPVEIVFAVVYVGMLIGRLPWLQLDRTGIALLGAIALLATRSVGLEEARNAIDIPTLALLFALMVVSAQLRLGGFYAHVTRALVMLRVGPATLLGALVLVVGALAAVFSNDVVCLTAAPVLLDACVARRLDPVPFLLGLACASNVGSAATLLGNPQNMLIGQTLALSFPGYLAEAGPPALLGLVATWALIALLYRGRWSREVAATPSPEEDPELNVWQTTKGLAVAAALLVAFLVAPWPREIVALAGAGLLLMSRRLHSRQMLGTVDWQLLVLFIGLFIVNDAFRRTGLPAEAAGAFARSGVDLTRPAWLFTATVLTSNVVSNVPAVMLLLPLAVHPLSGAVLALSSTLAGNLLVVGSIANIIVIDVASRRGVATPWRTHARIGLPVTIATLAIAALALWARAALSAS